jgi:hypothetical protein
MKKDWPTHDMGEDLKFIELSISQERKDNLKLYRFMSLDRFEDLFRKKAFFFAPAKILSDSFEGGYIISGLEELCLENRDSTFVSCWTKNDPLIESSLLMWRPHYNEENHIECENHIAIGVSINALFLNEDTSYLFRDKRFEKYMGNIKYLDQDDDYPKNYQANSLVPFFLKRTDYTDEKEIRIVIQDMKRKNSSRSFKKYQILNGIFVSIDLKKIDEFIVSPITESDIINKIANLIKKKRLNKPIKRAPMPSREAFTDAIEKVECLSELNNRQIKVDENSTEYEIIELNYPMNHFVSLGDKYVDASGNCIGVLGCSANSDSGKKKKNLYFKSVQQCQRSVRELK